MPDTFTIDKAQIVGLFLESVFYGIFLVTFFPCIRALIWDSGFKRRTTIHWPMLIVAFILAVFATMDVAIGLLHNIQAFVLYTGAGGAVEEFSDISDWVNVMKSVDIFVNICIGDAMLIYRCWIVYGKNYYVIILPMLLWMADTACACVLTWIEATLHNHSFLQVSKVKPFLSSFTSITIVQNIITTSLIVYRIWRVDRENAQFRYNTNTSIPGSKRSAPRRSRLQNVMRIVIESGLLYTTFAIISFITYVTNSNSFYVTTDAEVQIIGIAFNLIIIRADKQSSEEYTLPSTVGSIPLHSLKAPTASGTTVNTAEPKRGMQVMVMQETDLDSGFQAKTADYDHESNRSTRNAY